VAQPGTLLRRKLETPITIADQLLQAKAGTLLRLQAGNHPTPGKPDSPLMKPSVYWGLFFCYQFQYLPFCHTDDIPANHI